ncbi:hypothetical protein H257_09507 [Aphanomyces astaci]|uniref:Uncharacterized protein n=1 Tax=Aphanomyces astaci TaxID=112090 RepID=W4G9X7_APHAT|nr:hypothetical protein H257_09507 [Aphanomyces astaci]ETV76497.1 hypothetical protein H257_09507 [Aphanomyces astaci]|eukprot:XP_009834042.1 hypothetical protein H257_09507 [Aphanomyces astaci]
MVTVELYLLSRIVTSLSSHRMDVELNMNWRVSELRPRSRHHCRFTTWSSVSTATRLATMRNSTDGSPRRYQLLSNSTNSVSKSSVVDVTSILTEFPCSMNGVRIARAITVK